MKAWVIVGLVLIVIGLVGLVYGGITYSSRTDEIEFGGLKIQANQDRQLPLPPIVSALVLAAGVGAVVWGRRKRSA